MQRNNKKRLICCAAIGKNKQSLLSKFRLIAKLYENSMLQCNAS